MKNVKNDIRKITINARGMSDTFIKKSQKTPKKELKIAKNRMSEVIINDTF
jgi:hypothetical protein